MNTAQFLGVRVASKWVRADVVELVDTQDLGSCGASLESSSLSVRTSTNKHISTIFVPSPENLGSNTKST